MECLFFLSFSSIILLACYDGTCYLDETLYGWNNVYVQLAMYEWMELYMYARWNLCAGYVICSLLNSPVKYIYIYIYICHIFAVKIAGFKKTEKKGFAYSGKRQRMPTFAYSSTRQSLVPQWRPADVIRRTAKAGCSLQSVADGKGCR